MRCGLRLAALRLCFESANSAELKVAECRKPQAAPNAFINFFSKRPLLSPNLATKPFFLEPNTSSCRHQYVHFNQQTKAEVEKISDTLKSRNK